MAIWQNSNMVVGVLGRGWGGGGVVAGWGVGRGGCGGVVGAVGVCGVGGGGTIKTTIR